MRMTGNCTYLYGIINESKSKTFVFNGAEGSEIYTINHDRAAAVVSNTGLRDVDPARKHILAHAMVQDRLFSRYTLLPMGFGLIASSEAEVLSLLRHNYASILGELERLEGKVEIAIKVFWEQQAVAHALQEESRELSAIRAGLATSGCQIRAQQLLVQAGRMVESTVRDWESRYAWKIYTRLRQLALEWRLGERSGLRNLLNASFLVERGREPELRKEMYAMDTECGGRVSTKYIGPLPPYSFVSIRLSKGEEDAVNPHT